MEDEVAEEAVVAPRPELVPGSLCFPPSRFFERSRLKEPASRCCTMSEEESGAGRATPKAHINDWFVLLSLGMSKASIGLVSDD